MQIGLGETIRKNTWGRDRKYVVAFLGSGSPQEPLVDSERIAHPGAWNRLVAVVLDDDHEAMLTHALIQRRRRDRT